MHLTGLQYAGCTIAMRVWFPLAGAVPPQQLMAQVFQHMFRCPHASQPSDVLTELGLALAV